MGSKTQLCWKCDKATGGCSWAHNGTPVKGWTAEPTVIRDDTDINGSIIKSYRITKCPLFSPENRKQKRITLEELKNIFGVSRRCIGRWDEQTLIAKAEQKGLHLIIEREKEYRAFYITK